MRFPTYAMSGNAQAQAPRFPTDDIHAQNRGACTTLLFCDCAPSNILFVFPQERDRLGQSLLFQCGKVFGGRFGWTFEG